MHIIQEAITIFNTKLLYLIKNHKFLDLSHPKTFAEKISYLKLYNYNFNPVVNQLSDKFRMRQYVADLGFAENLSELYFVYSSANEINFGTLPNEFVLKWNFWYGLNIICQDKASADFDEIKSILNRYKRCNRFIFTGELQYVIPHKYKKMILCEKYIPNLIDYKFYYFNGKCKAVLVNCYNNDNTRSGSMYNPFNWTVIPMIKNYRYSDELRIEKPCCLQKMLEIGDALSGEFPFVRIDMYLDNMRPVIGELTFTPGAGITPTECILEGKTMGEVLKI